MCGSYFPATEIVPKTILRGIFPLPLSTFVTAAPPLCSLNQTTKHTLPQTSRRANYFNMADDDSSDLSSISSLSPPPSDDESDIQLEEKHGILKFFHKVDKTKATPKAQEPEEPSPPRPKREPSPPHEYVLADNPDIAVCEFIGYRVPRG
jgi:hypothetical protein